MIFIGFVACIASKIEKYFLAGIGHFLPTPSEIIEDQKYSASEPGLVRMITEGPENFREIAPVFIIQGITGKMNVKKMTTKLLYPTYCTVLPCSRWPIEKVAETYAQVCFFK